MESENSRISVQTNPSSCGLKLPEIIGLLLFLLCFGLLNYYTASATDWIPRDDAARHFSNSVKAFRALTAGNWTGFFLVDRYYPPLLYQTSALFYLIFPPGVLTSVISLLPYWVILIFSLYGIGQLLFSRLTGFLSLFYFITLPLSLCWSYQYMMDTPAAALSCLIFYLGLKADDFKDRRYSILWGLTLGLGMLLKWLVGYFLAGLILFYFLKLCLAYFKDWRWRTGWLAGWGTIIGLVFQLSLRFKPMGIWNHPWIFLIFGLFTAVAALVFQLSARGLIELAAKTDKTNPEAKAPLVNLVNALTLTWLLTGWIYLNPDFAVLSGKLYKAGLRDVGRSFGLRIPWDFFGYYYRSMLNEAFRPGYLTFFFIGFLVFFTRLKGNYSRQVLLFTLLSMAVLGAILPNRQDRYLLSLWALAAPLAVFWIQDLGRIKIIPILVLFVFGIFYTLGGLAIPADFYLRNPVLRFTIYGSDHLLNRKEAFKINDEFYRTFFAPLPKKGEKVMANIRITGRFKDSYEDDIVRIYPYLYPVNVDTGDYPRLCDYQYVVYAYSPGEGKDLIAEQLADHYPEAKRMNYPLISRYEFPQAGFELRLAKIAPKL